MLLFHPYGKLTSVGNGVIAWSVWKNETTPLLWKHDSKSKDGQMSNVELHLMLKPTDAAEANVDDTDKGNSS